MLSPRLWDNFRGSGAPFHKRRLCLEVSPNQFFSSNGQFVEIAQQTPTKSLVDCHENGPRAHYLALVIQYPSWRTTAPNLTVSPTFTGRIFIPTPEGITVVSSEFWDLFHAVLAHDLDQSLLG